MFKMTIKCGHCEKTSLASDEGGSVDIDFSKLSINFMCPHCNKLNLLPLSFASKHKAFPSIGIGK